jgi:hypothetical protein
MSGLLPPNAGTQPTGQGIDDEHGAITGRLE